MALVEASRYQQVLVAQEQVAIYILVLVLVVVGEEVLYISPLGVVRLGLEESFFCLRALQILEGGVCHFFLDIHCLQAVDLCSL